MPVSLHIIRQLGLLRSLPEHVLSELAPVMMLKEHPRRAVLMSKGQTATELGFLINGRLQGVDFTVDGRSVGLYFVEPGDFFGELAIVDEQPMPEFVVAAMNSTVAALDAQVARQLIFEHPAIAKEVMTRLTKRLRAITAQRTLLGLHNPFQRLCVLVVQLAQQASGPDATVLAIPQVPTHQELAIMINASRETVTRAFQVLFTHGVLLREGDELRVLNARMLQDIADGRQEPPKA